MATQITPSKQVSCPATKLDLETVTSWWSRQLSINAVR